MPCRLLVLYGTTDGHTAKVACALAETLRAQGAEVDLVDARHARSLPDAGRFEGTIVAASVHAGGYQRAVVRWVRAHLEQLARRPSAFVSVCLGILQHDPKVDEELTLIMTRFFLETGWRPTMSKAVAGALPYTRYNWLKRRIMRRIAAKAHGDIDTTRDFEYTDWADLRLFVRQFHRRFVSERIAQLRVVGEGASTASHS